ncbi:hypothetical protein AS9A_P20023 (plasmid) [Hoyosella subflava DQS3-9A1]|uniref:Uncharacterized protein n=1 Tax=Hoyosella subflava (strain DSM 45089 / JCM 17490 / NBRC 109087 / DQS3-9A1) TaxID=443218 RepID=F6ESE6_HOYSD|nr:hypothetical protein AS9A_P20023 [Hoyosella subflava DQS3-9A1]
MASAATSPHSPITGGITQHATTGGDRQSLGSQRLPAAGNASGWRPNSAPTVLGFATHSP